MTETEAYQRLEAAATVVAGHANYSGKQTLVQSCLGDVEHRFGQGRLSSRQRTRLISILLGREGPASIRRDGVTPPPDRQ